MSALLFGFIDIIIIFLLEVPIFYFLVKVFYKNTKFINTLKALLLYELFYFIFACFYPRAGGKFFYIVSPFIILIISFGLFFLVTQLTRLIKWKQWKKGIALFVLMFIIATPLLDYLNNALVIKPMVKNIEFPYTREAQNLFKPFYQESLGWVIEENLNRSVTNSLFSTSVVNFIFALRNF